MGVIPGFYLIDFCSRFTFCVVCSDEVRGRRIRRWLGEHCVDLAGRGEEWDCPLKMPRTQPSRALSWQQAVKIIRGLPAGEYEDNLRDFLRVTEDVLEVQEFRSPCWKGRQRGRVVDYLKLYQQRNNGGV